MTNPDETPASLDLSADEMLLLDQLLADSGVAAGDAVIGPGPIAPAHHVSFSQELLWSLDRASPG